MKFIFVLGLSFIILPSLLLPVTNKTLLIRFIMDTKLFNAIAKISFCTYLIHLTIIYWYLGGLKYDVYFTYLSFYVLFIVFTVYSFVFGTILVYLV
jgi:peptidoglycan/LPS O-acetylase OafA/YrhL